MDLMALLGEDYKEDMTFADITEALANKELVEKSVLSDYVPKATADKYATEAAGYKKQLREKQTEDERRAAEEAAKQETIMQELETLRHQSAVSDFKTKFLELKYAPELAASTAEALAKGEYDIVLKNQAVHVEAQIKAVKAEAMANMQMPPAGITSDAAAISEYTKLRDTAITNGDMSNAAYYTRRIQEEESKQN